MKIYHFCGNDDCKSLGELSEILEIRYDKRINEFTLIDEERKYPFLEIMVNDENASLTFYPKERGQMFQSIGENNGMNSNETSLFFIGTPNQETEVGNEFVVPFAKAKEAAIEFFSTLSLPTCIEWSEQ